MSGTLLGHHLFAWLSLKNRGSANDHSESLSILITTSHAREEEFKDARHEIQNTTAEIGEIRDVVTSIQQQTQFIQASTSSHRSTVETLENLQRYQEDHLPKLKNHIETLPEVIEELLDRKFNELLLNAQLTGSQRIVAMPNSVSRINIWTFQH